MVSFRNICRGVNNSSNLCSIFGYLSESPDSIICPLELWVMRKVLGNEERYTSFSARPLQKRQLSQIFKCLDHQRSQCERFLTHRNPTIYTLRCAAYFRTLASACQKHCYLLHNISDLIRMPILCGPPIFDGFINFCH